MGKALEKLRDVAKSIYSPDINVRVNIFRNEVGSALDNTDMSSELASLLVRMIFETLYIYDDDESKKAVDDVIERALSQVSFLDTFAETIVRFMEKQLRSQSLTEKELMSQSLKRCYRLLKWSCLLLSKSQFASVSKNVMCRIVGAQASFLHTAVQESFRDPSYKLILFHLFSEVLNSQTRLSKDLLPLFTYLVHSGISEVSLGDLLKSVLFDPSKILAVVLPQADLEDEERRPEALVLVGCSGDCSNPEVVEALCSAVKSVIGGPKGRLALPYKREGIINAVQELSRDTEVKFLVCRIVNLQNEFLENLLDDFYENHLPSLLSTYESQETLSLFKYVSVEEFLEAYARLPREEVEDFYSFMLQNGIRVDTEATTRLLKNPIARIIPRRPRDKWIKANCDAGFEEVEGGEVICVGAVVFTCPNGEIKGSRRVQFYDVRCPSFAEFRGFGLAIDESILRQYNKVLIEMDCNNVVNALRGGLPFPTKRWDDYRNLPLKSMKDYEICHIPREGNKLADLLVKIAKFEVKKLSVNKLWKEFERLADHNEQWKPTFKVNTKLEALHSHNPLGIIWKRLSVDLAMKLSMKLKQGKIRI